MRSLSSSAAPEGGAKTRPLYGTPPTRAPPFSVGRAAWASPCWGTAKSPSFFCGARWMGNSRPASPHFIIIIIIRSSRRLLPSFLAVSYKNSPNVVCVCCHFEYKTPPSCIFKKSAPPIIGFTISTGHDCFGEVR